MKEVLLGLGSNKSFNGLSPLKILEAATVEISKILINPLFSSIYKTRPMYVTNQDDFFNMVAFGFVPDDADSYKFLEKLHKIEAEYGRDRKSEIRNGPRTLDLDIEIWGKEKFNDDILSIPHPRISERAFVLVPALEILPKSAENLRRDFLSYLSKIDSSDVEKIS